MVRITDQKLLEFVRRHMEGRDRLASADIRIVGIPDLFAYRALPSRASLARSVRIGEFTVIFEKGARTANDWIDVTAFRIERTEAKGHVA